MTKIMAHKFWILLLSLFFFVDGMAQRYNLNCDLGYTKVGQDVIYAQVDGFYVAHSTDGLAPKQSQDYMIRIWKSYQETVLREGIVPLELSLDIYTPKRDSYSRRPLIVFVHGGAFLLGDKGDMLGRLIGENYARRGYVVASINYRLGCSFLGLSAIKRSIYRSVQDLRQATAYLVNNAGRYGIDPQQIFYIGHSAGGMTVLATAFMQEGQEYQARSDNMFRHDLGDLPYAPRPRAIVSLCGAITDLDLINKDDAVAALLIHGEEDDLLPLDKGFPFKILLGRRLSSLGSMFYNVYGSRPIARRMRDVGLSAKLDIIPGVKHDLLINEQGGISQDWAEVDRYIATFLLSCLK